MYYVPYMYPYYRYAPVPQNAHYYYPQSNHHPTQQQRERLTDQGPNPFVIDIEDAAEANNMYRTTLWTGDYMQVTLMSIPIGEDIGLEVHDNHDQFLRIEDGNGMVAMGPSKDELTFRRYISEDIAIIVPAGTWHNITNTGNEPLKLYSIYTPPEHPFDTVHPTKADAMAAEGY